VRLKISLSGRPKCTTCLGRSAKRTLVTAISRSRILRGQGPRYRNGRHGSAREKLDFEVDFRIDLPTVRKDRTFVDISRRVTTVTVLDAGWHAHRCHRKQHTRQGGAPPPATKRFCRNKKVEIACDGHRPDPDPGLARRTGRGPDSSYNQPSTINVSRLRPAETGWPSAFHPDDKKGMLQKWTAIRQSGRQATCGRLRRYDGDIVFLFSAKPLRDEAGTLSNGMSSLPTLRPPADRGRPSRERAALSRLCRKRVRLALGERTDHLVTAVGDTLSAVGHRAFTPDWRGSWTLRPMSRIGARKMAMASDDDRRTSAIARFVYRTPNRVGTPVLYVRTRASTLDARAISRYAQARHRYYGEDHAPITAERALREAQAALAHVNERGRRWAN